MPRQSPHPNGTPTSAGVSQPRSSASQTNASVTPIEIVSIPSRSQRSLARISASGLAMPSMGPSAKIDSYSGILARVPANSPSEIAYCLPHATGHFRHVVSRSW